MKEENFTPGQVGTRLEGMDKKIDLIAESVGSLQGDMTEVKERLTKVETRLINVEDAVRVAIRVAIPSLAKRVDRLESKSRF